MATKKKAVYEYKKKRPKAIVHVKTKEQEAFKCLWRTGVITKNQLQQYFDLKGQRLLNMEHSGFLEIKNDIVVLSNKGIQYCQENLQMKYRYYSSGTKYNHDLKQTQAYLNLPKYIQDTWKTEGELRAEAEASPLFERFRDDIQETFGGRFKPTPDAAIYSEKAGGYVAFECVTKNYTEQDVQMKHAFANTFLNGIITYRV
jgi:hypothetical protein